MDFRWSSIFSMRYPAMPDAMFRFGSRSKEFYWLKQKYKETGQRPIAAGRIRPALDGALLLCHLSSDTDSTSLSFRQQNARRHPATIRVEKRIRSRSPLLGPRDEACRPRGDPLSRVRIHPMAYWDDSRFDRRVGFHPD